jgi:hypothetical protein
MKEVCLPQKQALYNLGSDKKTVNVLRAASASRICAQSFLTIVNNDRNYNDCSPCVSNAVHSEVLSIVGGLQQGALSLSKESNDRQPNKYTKMALSVS